MLICLSMQQMTFEHIAECAKNPKYFNRFFNVIFNWRKIALQCCDGFCHTTMQISQNCVCVYIYIYVISLLSLPLLLSSHPSRPSQSTCWAPCVTYKLLTSYLFYTLQCIYVYATLSICPSLFSPTVSTSPFSIPASPFLPCKQVINTIFLDSI